MYRFLLISGLLVVLYFLLRQAVRSFKNKEIGDGGASVDHGQMVEDPECHTFVPRNTAVIERIDGQTYCFCSKQCAIAFQNRQAG
jgi:YHS domain-containing protein